jgi:hypothetical protein
MNPPNPCGTRRALELLVAQLGGTEVLCRRLWISQRDLDGYLSGSQAVPLCVSMHALDILSGERSGLRVA